MLINLNINKREVFLMKKKLLILSLCIFILIVLINTASAITGGTRVPHVYVKYYTVPDEVTSYINLINGNDYTATVTMTPSANIAGMIEFSENPVVMAPGEERYIPFNVTVTQQLTWNGQINANFYVPQDNMKNWPINIEVTISKGSCADGETKSCITDGCAGTQTCQSNDFGDCVKNNPLCGLSGECIEAWTCTPWSACQPNNYQVRTCTDLHDCGTELNKPAETQACIYGNVDCNCTDIINRLQILENDVSALESLVASIQSLIANIQISITSILARVTALENDQPAPTGCAYDNPPCGEGYQCVSNECVLIEECVESWSCSDWSGCASGTQTRTCTDAHSCGTTVFKPAVTQTCTSSDLLVIFRTNVADGNYIYSSPGSWIAVDCNKDGILEAYGGLGSSRTGKVSNPIGITPEGYSYECFNGNTEVRIKTGTREIVYLKSITPTEAPVLSSEPTEPYASNNQEVYE